MMEIETCERNILNAPKTWLITGVAGFIGVIFLKVNSPNQRVVGLDNFSGL